jgi:acetyl esterase/lipase
MSHTAEDVPSAHAARRRKNFLRAGRFLAWAGLLGVTGVFVRAEARRPELPPGVAVETGLVYRRLDGRRLKLDLYRPKGVTPPARGWPAVVAIHGGGWRGGSRREYGPIVSILAQHGLAVAVVDYRLSRPGAPSWPANLDDAREALRWVQAQGPKYGIDPSRVAALGASAGGHLAALLGTWPEGTPEGIPPARAGVRAVVAFYGPMDLATMSPASRQPGGPVDLLLGGSPEQQPARAAAASPAQHVTADDPPMLLIQGEQDQLVPPAQARDMARRLHAAGIDHELIVLPEEGHGFSLVARGRQLAVEILAFLDRAWKDDTGGSERGQAP